MGLGGGTHAAAAISGAVGTHAVFAWCLARTLSPARGRAAHSRPPQRRGSETSSGSHGLELHGRNRRIRLRELLLAEALKSKAY